MNTFDYNQKKKYKANDIHIGDLLSVYIRNTIPNTTKIKKELFDGICIAIKGTGISKTFTIRKTSFKGAIEKILPLFSPLIENIIVKQKHKIKRAKLYYLRSIIGKKKRLKKYREK